MVTETKQKLHLALVGLGNQGQEHLLGMQDSQHTVFVAGVDVSPKQRKYTQQKYPDIQLFENIEQLAIQAPSLQLAGLVLCLPHQCYQDIWQKIVQMHLPVLKEKPLARNMEEARQLTQDIPGKRLKTAIQRRHHPSYLQLKTMLAQDRVRIHEIHTWLHLGRAYDPTRTDWRSQQHHAGGGILLDAGYHLVDLVHFLIGPIELVNCNTWSQHQQSAPETIEDEALLIGRNDHCWVVIDARLGGLPDTQGVLQKSEGIRLETDQGSYFANRSEVSRDGKILWQGERNWQQAMSRQLDEFASDIRINHWNTSSYWDQLPAMQLIENAYQLSRRF